MEVHSATAATPWLRFRPSSMACTRCASWWSTRAAAQSSASLTRSSKHSQWRGAFFTWPRLRRTMRVGSRRASGPTCRLSLSLLCDRCRGADARYLGALTGVAGTVERPSSLKAHGTSSTWCRERSVEATGRTTSSLRACGAILRRATALLSSSWQSGETDAPR